MWKRAICPEGEIMNWTTEIIKKNYLYDTSPEADMDAIIEFGRFPYSILARRQYTDKIVYEELVSIDNKQWIILKSHTELSNEGKK